MTRSLQANWIQGNDTERWVASMVKGRAINVCCGMSRVGEVRVDTDDTSNRTEYGTIHSVVEKYPRRSFQTLICDPPYSFFNEFRWLHKLSDLASDRLIISSDRVDLRITFPDINWTQRVFLTGHGLAIRIYWVFDRKDASLTAEKHTDESVEGRAGLQ